MPAQVLLCIRIQSYYTLFVTKLIAMLGSITTMLIAILGTYSWYLTSWKLRKYARAPSCSESCVGRTGIAQSTAAMLLTCLCLSVQLFKGSYMLRKGRDQLAHIHLLRCTTSVQVWELPSPGGCCK